MPIHFTCPHCGIATDLDDQYTGQSEPCLHCGKTIGIPPAEDGTSLGSAGARPTRRQSLGGLLLAIVLGCGGFCYFLFPTIYATLEATKAAACRDNCTNHLKRIGLAMHNYQEKYGCFPPAYIPDENGKPKHSWRVLILPFMDYQPLYAAYRFDEPWNSMHNMELAAKMPDEYRCPRAPTPKKPGITNYVMLVGPHAISNGPTAHRITDIIDGLKNTIMVTDGVGANVNWLEPRDLDVDTMTFRILHPGNKPTPQVTDISSGHPMLAVVVMCDGIVKTLPDDIDPKLLEALTTIDGGETVNFSGSTGQPTW